jgi:hypothetical protein
MLIAPNVDGHFKNDKMRHIFFFLILIITLDSYSQDKVRHHYLINDISIIDVRDGNILTHRWVGIDSNRTTKIYYIKVLPSSKTIAINGTGKFLIPGLWDMHVHYHWNYTKTTPFLIANGVVGVREMFGDMKNVKMIREMMKSGTFIGPEIISSGALIDGVHPAFDGEDIAPDSATAIEIIKKQKAEGVDFLKIYNDLRREPYFAIAAQAKIYNLDFCGHIPFNVSAWDAISAGQKSIEHTYGLLEATSPGLDSLLRHFQAISFKVPNWKAEMYNFIVDNHSEESFDRLIYKLANSKTWICPTMVALEGIAYQFEGSFKYDLRKKYIPQDINISMSNDTAWVYAFRRKYEFEKKLLKKMIDGGVKFLAGTDFIYIHTYPGFSLHDELGIFNKAGFTPLQALQTATLNPAIYFDKLNEYGTIDEHKIASLLILNSNPLQNISNTKDIEAVFLKGNYFSKTDIDSLLTTNVN